MKVRKYSAIPMYRLMSVVIPSSSKPRAMGERCTSATSKRSQSGRPAISRRAPEAAGELSCRPVRRNHSPTKKASDASPPLISIAAQCLLIHDAYHLARDTQGTKRRHFLREGRILTSERAPMNIATVKEYFFICQKNHYGSQDLAQSQRPGYDFDSEM